MTNHSDPIIEVRGLTKRYGATTVVDQVDLTVHRGEIFGLLGANGAGKTTTVECLQGLRRSDAGTIRLCGLDPLTEAAKLAGRVGSQLQDSALPDRLRVGEALRLFATERAAPIDEVLDDWGLTGQRRTAFANLSGGQQQRLFVALALLNRPEVVFLDELTQGLDPAARRVVWELISALRNRGTTVVLVTHFMDEAEVLCDRIAVMANGRIVDRGTPSELIERQGHPSRMVFTPPPTIAIPDLGRLPGVASVAVIGGRVEIDGSRDMVAHVGAALVANGTVPADIDVRQLQLEDALLPLLGAPVAGGAQ